MQTHTSKHNQDVWDALAQSQCAWSQPVSSDVIKAAKAGHWQVHITKKALTENWLPKDIQGKKILCLASAGGQQAPVLAAAGADVTDAAAAGAAAAADDGAWGTSANA